MPKFGGVVILMQQNLNEESVFDNEEIKGKIKYLVGNSDVIKKMPSVPVKTPFSEEVIDFLSRFSKLLINSSEAKNYPDIVTLGFWLRKASLYKLKERFKFLDNNIHVGRGIAFHIAPSNIPVNYMYSLVAGLLTGNINIVRVPSKDFQQVKIINTILNEVLMEYQEIQPYICLIRYEREKQINDLLSSIADTRIIWGGDETIRRLRQSPLQPRAREIAFADRFSFSIINSDVYLDKEDKLRVAENFYNDTYLTDQNACTSPRLIVWTGNKKEQAKKLFWDTLHELVRKKYNFQPIMGINKLTSAYLMAVQEDGVKIETNRDNLIVRIRIANLNKNIIEMRENSGYFFEYDCENLLDLKEFCNDKRIQTIGIIGNKLEIEELLLSGIRGLDRVVPIGKTMDFDLIWDGYNLVEGLTRIIFF